MSSNRKSVNFEKSLAELEALVERMEHGELSLEESLKAFETGIRLSKQCQQALSRAEQRVQLLIEQDGGLEAVPFEDDEVAQDEPDPTDTEPD